ncbi:MAG: P-loop NTPase [Catenulisporales bacterium]|nr:P-loop NTPase [Catenulisporales bacterium]
MRELTQHPASGRPDRAGGHDQDWARGWEPDQARARSQRPGAADPSAPSAPPLAVTSDSVLAEALSRAAAEAGVRLDVVPHPGAARRRWSAAPLVLVGVDQAGAVVRAGLPRRPEVALVGRDLDDATVWRRGTALGAAHVLILPDCERWLAGMLAEADSPHDDPGALVAILSGRGGAGGSTLAAALALAGTRRGLRSTLVDLDPVGGGIDLLFGLETEPGPRWSELARWREGRLCGRSLRDALPTYAARSRRGLAAGLGFTEEGADRLPVLAWPRTDRGTEAGDAGEQPARPSEKDLWYESGTQPHPLGFDDGDAPLSGNGSSVIGDSLDDADESAPGSSSRAGGATLYQDADSQPAPGLPVLTWPRTRTDVPLPAVGAEPVRAVLNALNQAGDLVVVDLPRSVDEAATEALALATTALIVVPAEVRASAAASQLAAAVRLITSDLRVVVRLPAPGGLEPLDITDVMGGLPLAGVIAADRRLSAAAEHGLPPGSSARGTLSAFCRTFLDDLFGAPARRYESESRAAA